MNTTLNISIHRRSFCAVLATLSSVLAAGNCGAVTINLGTAASFAVLAGSTVTNTGPTVIGGNVGVAPGTAITGFPPGIVTPPYVIHSADAVALQAQSDLTIAYNVAAGLAPTGTLTGTDLGGLTLLPGVYFFASSAQLTGTLTLDAQGNPDSEFIFQIGSTLTTASASMVSLLNGASNCNVFFQVGSSATLGTGTDFTGNILALTSISLNTGATLDGRALARNGAVTLDSNVIQPSDCHTESVPETGNTVFLFAAGLIGLMSFRKLRPSMPVAPASAR